MTGHLKFNIGKAGYNPNIVLTLQTAFKTRENLKVVVLKSAREKENVNQIAEKLVNALGKNYTYRVMGYTIFLKRWRRFTKNAKNKAR
jgi:RNA-binding protein YhbY